MGIDESMTPEEIKARSADLNRDAYASKKAKAAAAAAAAAAAQDDGDEVDQLASDSDDILDMSSDRVSELVAAHSCPRADPTPPSSSPPSLPLPSPRRPAVSTALQTSTNRSRKRDALEGETGDARGKRAKRGVE